MVYNDVDQLVAWPGMHGDDAETPGYAYDDNGNLVEVKDAGGTSSVVTYTYDQDTNLLESATYGGHTLTNTWDVFGNRSSVAVNGRTYSFAYNILAGIPAVIEEVDSGTNGKTYYYYRDPGGALIARRDASDPNSLQYYHYDELGSTRIITNKDGQVTDTYAYDAYGSVISHVGSTTDNPYQYVGALGYYTHYQDPEFKLLQLGYRFYDPETGRFTQQDPAGDGINWYAYCGGNPMAGVDPWGLFDLIGCIRKIGHGIRNGAVAGYDYWASGELGSHIPVLGNLYAQAGTAYGNWESGRGGGWTAAWSITKAFGGTVIGGVVIYYAGGEISVGIARSRFGTPETPSVPGGPSYNQPGGRPNPSKLRKSWEEENGQPWPTDPNGRNYDVSHRVPRADGGTDDPDNIFPELRRDHIQRHSDNGDFVRWGKRGSDCDD